MEEKQYPVGINVLGGAGLSQAQHIALIAEAGWDAFFTGWDPDRIGKWADAGARAGLTYASVHAPFGEVNRMWEAGDAAEHGSAPIHRIPGSYALPDRHRQLPPCCGSG